MPQGPPPSVPDNHEVRALLYLWLHHFAAQKLEGAVSRANAIDRAVRRLQRSYRDVTGDQVAREFDNALASGDIQEEKGKFVPGYMEIDTADVAFADLSRVTDRLRQFTVNLLPADRRGNPLREPLGSGVLIKHRGRYGILTASHVWTDVKKSGAPRLLTFLDRGGYETLEMDSGRPDDDSGWREANAFKVDAESRSWPLTSFQVIKTVPRTGGLPDIALLLEWPAAPPERLININTYYRAAAYEMDDDRPDPPHGVVYGLLGTMGKDSDVPEGTFRSVFVSAAVKKVFRRGRFDYADLDLTYKPGMPTTYEGMSGGGLWYVPILHWRGEASPRCYERLSVLRGIAIDEDGDMTRFGAMVRCHGPKSLVQLLKRVP